MARRLGDFDFTNTPPNVVSPYPLRQWMDGSVWEIVQGEDFEGPVRYMQSRLHHYARTRGMRVRTQRLVDRERPERRGVVFQFYAASDERGLA